MGIPIGVGIVLSVADQVLSYFGIAPNAIGARILGGGGDKKRRLMQIEMMGNMTAVHVANTLKAIEGKDPETASAIKDGLILTLSQALAEMVKAADLDGSSTGTP